MNKNIDKLINKKFKVWVGGEVERTTDFWGMITLLARYSDFFTYTASEQNKIVSKEWLDDKTVYIDANITLTF